MKRSKKCICKFGKPSSEGTMRWWPNEGCSVHTKRWCLSRTKKHTLSELPVEFMKDIINAATKVAGWTSPKKKGKGSTMLMEWVSFTYTLKEWEKHLRWCKEVEQSKIAEKGGRSV